MLVSYAVAGKANIKAAAEAVNPFTTVDVYIRHDVCTCPTDDVYIRPRCTSRLY